MKGILKLNLITNGYESYFLTQDLNNNNSYILNCFIDIEIPITKIHSNNYIIKKNLVEQYINTNNKQLKEVIYNYINNNFDLVTNCDSIIIDSLDELIIEYLNKNPILYEKKITIKRNYNLSDLDYVKSIYKNIPNLYVYIKENKESITINDYEKTVNEINKIINKVKKYNFSQLEQIMYVYDLIRERVYKKENPTDSENLSRDLTSVLLGDKIVCVGYAKIFEQVLLGLNIQVSQHQLINKLTNNSGHVLNVVYVNDKKYNIEGIYYFDLTWDSKTKENDNSYLNSYKYFAKTKEEIGVHYNEKYYDENFKATNENIINELITLLKKRNITNITDEIKEKINELSMFISKKDILYFDDINLNISLNISKKRFFKKNHPNEIIEVLEGYKRLLNQPININTLLEVLYNVRKIEYYESPSKYLFDLKYLALTAYNSQWKFNENSKEYFPNILFNTIPSQASEFKKDIKNYATTKKLEQNISKVKVTKVLKRICEQKSKIDTNL